MSKKQFYRVCIFFIGCLMYCVTKGKSFEYAKELIDNSTNLVSIGE
jgi:hypothetical protein